MTTRQVGANPGTAQHSDSWTTVHARSAAVREVVAALDAGLPLPEACDVPVTWPFADRDDLLLALHEAWSRRLGGRIDVALETGDDALAESVARAWSDTAEDLPGIRRVLDEHADRPALRQVLRHEHRTVAVAAGLATFDDPSDSSAAAGARLVRAARARTTVPVTRRSWWRRLTG